MAGTGTVRRSKNVRPELEDNPKDVIWTIGEQKKSGKETETENRQTEEEKERELVTEGLSQRQRWAEK